MYEDPFYVFCLVISSDANKGRAMGQLLISLFNDVYFREQPVAGWRTRRLTGVSVSLMWNESDWLQKTALALDSF